MARHPFSTATQMVTYPIGTISEQLACRHNNQGLADSGVDRKLQVILRGELFQCFKELQSDFWATNLNDLKTYLELYLEDGRGQLPREKIATLLESSLPFDTHDGNAPGGRESARAIAGAAIICASAISESVPKGGLKRRKGMNPKPYPSDLTSQQWAVLKPLLPPARIGGRPRKTEMRSVVNAIFYRNRNGCIWRALPTIFPLEDRLQLLCGVETRWNLEDHQ